MTTDSNNPAKHTSDGRPTVEEVIARLDRLYAPPPLPAFGPKAGQRIDHYEIDRPLGHGTFGVVYLARDLMLDRDVALKFPRPEVLLDAAKRRRFESEAKVSARFDHPAIVPIHEANLDGPTPYIASAYCPGMDLADWLAGRDSPVPYEQAVRLVIQLARAVQYAHEQGVVHRDLKPGNVLLISMDGDGEAFAELDQYAPRLTDFGLAKLTDGALPDTRSSVLVGTPLYMAPEQLDGNVPEAWAAAVDVYALGCLLFEVLTGRTPIEGTTYVEVADALRKTPPPKLRNLRRDVPRELETICAICLEKEPQARYHSVGALADDLQNCLDGRPIHGRPPSLLERFTVWRRLPQRIREAGIYALLIHILLSLYLAACVFGLHHLQWLSGRELHDTLWEVFSAWITLHVPMAILGAMTWRGHGWAIWLGAAMSVFCVLAPLLSILGLAPVFTFVYRNAEYHAFTGYSMILILMLVQLLFYTFAVAAYRHMQRGRLV